MYVFPLQKNEAILKKDMATMESGDLTVIGALYLTTERLVFLGYTRTSITSTVEDEIPLVHIREINAAKTLAVLANAIDIATIRGRRFKFLLSNRDQWMEAIKDQMDKL